MDSDKEKPDEKENEHTPAEESQAPADALSRTPEELEEEQAAQEAEHPKAPEPQEKKLSPIRRLFRRFNVYFLLFVLIMVVACVIVAVNYLNSQKPPKESTIESRSLTEDALKQLSNTDVSVGDASQTFTIQGNAIVTGQTLMRGDLNVAGNFQTGGSIKGPSITISGSSNLGATQANSLQVAQDVAIQGNTSMRDLSVSGSSTFKGAMTASQITASRLILSGNAVLEVPNHLAFTGPSPSRTINTSALGSGGSASVNGSDTTGTVNINTGNSPAAGCFVRIAFRQAFTRQPHVIISPIGAGAGRTSYYVTRDTNGFSICAATPAPAHQAFGFDYFVTG